MNSDVVSFGSVFCFKNVCFLDAIIENYVNDIPRYFLFDKNRFKNVIKSFSCTNKIGNMRILGNLQFFLNENFEQLFRDVNLH